MKNFKAPGSGRAALSAVLLGLSAALAYGDEELSTTTSSSVPTEELGTGNFSPFPFKVSLWARGGYDDNVSTTKHAEESSFVNTGVQITYDFGDPRTTLNLQTGAGFTYYFDKPRGIGFGSDQEYDINIFVGFNMEHKASPRLSFNLQTYATFQTEPDFSSALGVNRRTGNYFYTQDKFSVSYLWAPRFSTTTSYTFGAVAYEEDQIALFEDRFENTFGNEFKFLLSSTTALVAEYRFGLVNYTHEGDVIAEAVPAHIEFIDGVLLFVPATPAHHLQRDSISHYVLAGFDHSFSPRLSVSFRGGAQFRDYIDDDEQGLDETKGSPYFEGTANYAVGKDTAVSWTNRYSIEEGEVLLNPSRTTFRTGLSARHTFTPKISASLGLYYEHDDYDSIHTPSVNVSGFTEQSIDVAVSARYSVTRYIGIEVGYNHTEIWGDISAREYARNRYWGGINVMF